MRFEPNLWVRGMNRLAAMIVPPSDTEESCVGYFSESFDVWDTLGA